MTQREEFNALSERILHSIIRSGNWGIVGVGPSKLYDRGLVEKAIQLAEDLMLAQCERALALPSTLTAEETQWLVNGQYFKVLRSVRERTGASLKEAKTIVDKARSGIGPKPLNSVKE